MYTYDALLKFITETLQIKEFSMSFKTKFNDNLKQLNKNVRELEQTVQVTLDELMNPQFMSNCSKFPSLNELFEKSGFKIESPEDFAAIPDEEWDAFIKESTTYENWLEMQMAAHEEYASKYINATLSKGIK